MNTFTFRISSDKFPWYICPSIVDRSTVCSVFMPTESSSHQLLQNEICNDRKLSHLIILLANVCVCACVFVWRMWFLQNSNGIVILKDYYYYCRLCVCQLVLLYCRVCVCIFCFQCPIITTVASVHILINQKSENDCSKSNQLLAQKDRKMEENEGGWYE